MTSPKSENTSPEPDDTDGAEGPSKSQLKREADEITRLGQNISELGAADLAKLPLEENVADAVHALRKIRSNVARKRQLHYLGKILRKSDITPIRDALQAIQLESQVQNRHFHAAERWRDRLLNDGQKALQEFVHDYPATDRQRLRQLIRNHARESELIAAGKTPSSKAAREVFKMVRYALSE